MRRRKEGKKEGGEKRRKKGRMKGMKGIWEERRENGKKEGRKGEWKEWRKKERKERLAIWLLDFFRRLVFETSTKSKTFAISGFDFNPSSGKKKNLVGLQRQCNL